MIYAAPAPPRGGLRQGAPRRLAWLIAWVTSRTRAPYGDAIRDMPNTCTCARYTCSLALGRVLRESSFGRHSFMGKEQETNDLLTRGP